YLMDNLGIETGINEDELLKAAFYIQNKLGKNLPSRSLTYELSQMSEGIDSDVLAQKHRRKRDMMYDFLKYQYEIVRKIEQYLKQQNAKQREHLRIYLKFPM